MKYDELIKQLRCYAKSEEDALKHFIPKLAMAEAADAIEELQSQLPKWIPVTERLPDIGKPVLVISYGRVCYAKLLLTKNNGGFPTFVLDDGLSNNPVLETTAHNEFTKNRITHWMPLPEPPKEE